MGGKSAGTECRTIRYMSRGYSGQQSHDTGCAKHGCAAHAAGALGRKILAVWKLWPFLPYLLTGSWLLPNYLRTVEENIWIRIPIWSFWPKSEHFHAHLRFPVRDFLDRFSQVCFFFLWKAYKATRKRKMYLVSLYVNALGWLCDWWGAVNTEGIYGEPIR